MQTYREKYERREEKSEQEKREQWPFRMIKGQSLGKEHGGEKEKTRKERGEKNLEGERAISKNIKWREGKKSGKSVEGFSPYRVPLSP